MTIRIFAIEGTRLAQGQQVAACASLGCRAVGDTIGSALDALAAQIQAVCAEKLAGLGVQLDVDVSDGSTADPLAPQWSSTVTFATDETPLQGIQVEARLGLPFDKDVVLNLFYHVKFADSLAAYTEVITAIDWYCAQAAFPAQFRPALADLWSQATDCCAILHDEAVHLRDHTVTYRLIDEELEQQPRN